MKNNTDLELYFSFPPTVNNYYRRAKTSGVFLSKRAGQFRQAILKELEEQTHGLKLTYRLFVEVTLHMPDRRCRDLDNYMKALLDAITHGGLWEDDSQIDQLHIYRGAITKGGLVKVVITEAGPVIPITVKK